MSGATSRRKGASHERDVVAWLKVNRPALRRTMFAGNNDAGDVGGWPGVVIECKNQARIDLAGWVDQMEATVERCGADTGVVVAKRRGVTDPGRYYAVMTLERWEALMRDAGR